MFGSNRVRLFWLAMVIDPARSRELGLDIACLPFALASRVHAEIIANLLGGSAIYG
jgi:hypothetical protein